MSEKNVKIPKWSHAFKRYESSCNVEILKISIKDTESAIQNKLIDLLPELEGFKFVTILVLEFKKIQCDDKTLYCTFIRTQKQKKLSMKVTLIMYLNQSIVILYQGYKSLKDKVKVPFLIQS